MKYYKLTNAAGRTYNGTQWGEGITHTAAREGKTLCTDEVIHVYASPLLSVLLNPIHANFYRPRLWECECSQPVANAGTKVGVKKCTTLGEIPLPKVTTKQRVKFAILCALEVYHASEFVLWADGWLTGRDRSKPLAYAAANAAAAAAKAAYAAANDAYAAADVAYAAANVANAAAKAAYAAANAAYAAANAAAHAAARAAADAAARAAYASKLNLSEIAEKAMT